MEPRRMPRFRLIAILSLSFLGMAPSFAQHMNEKGSPCTRAVTTLEMTKCFYKAKDVSDQELNSVYQLVRGKLEADDAKLLTATQRIWIQYRDANCSAERAL